jgi:hypothetical protein
MALRQFLLASLWLFALLSQCSLATALTPLVCLDEPDAMTLLNQARPFDALMRYIYGDLTDVAFVTLLQGYKVVRPLNDPSGVLDVRRYDQRRSLGQCLCWLTRVP